MATNWEPAARQQQPTGGDRRISVRDAKAVENPLNADHDDPMRARGGIETKQERKEGTSGAARTKLFKVSGGTATGLDQQQSALPGRKEGGAQEVPEPVAGASAAADTATDEEDVTVENPLSKEMEEKRNAAAENGVPALNQAQQQALVTKKAVPGLLSFATIIVSLCQTTGMVVDVDIPWPSRWIQVRKK